MHRRFTIGLIACSLLVAGTAISAIRAFAQFPSEPDTLEQPHSTLVTAHIESAILQGDRVATVYLPAGYTYSPNQRYATLYMLHGAPGAYRDWTDNANLQATADRLIAAHVLPPTIIVVPDGNYGALGDTQWVNGNTGAGFGRIEDFVVDELVPAIDARYRTLPDRTERAIGGLSAGAYGAVNLAFRHPDVWSIVAVHSGFYRAQPTDNGTDVFAGDDDAHHANSPIEQIGTNPAIRTLAIYFDVGSDDPWFVDDTREFDEALSVAGIPHTFKIFSGGHTWEYWAEHASDSLAFVGEHLRSNTH